MAATIQIIATQGALVLRHKHSELVIMPQHVENLEKLTEPREFSKYFLDYALVNRPARKLFVAWVKKDSTLWKGIYESIHNNKDKKEPSAEADTKEVKEA